MLAIGYHRTTSLTCLRLVAYGCIEPPFLPILVKRSPHRDTTIAICTLFIPMVKVVTGPGESGMLNDSGRVYNSAVVVNRT